MNGHLLQNALTYDTNQNVTSPVKFLNGFEIPNGDLKIDTLNQVNWNLMQQIGVYPALLKQHGLKKNVTIRNLCSIGGSLNAEQLKVNGENLEDILSDLVYAVYYEHSTFQVMIILLILTILSRSGRR